LLERLRGMFAFALYDVRRGLVVARDRLGIKPLYYHSGPGVIVFASEVKARLASGLVPDERDRNALAGFLMAGAVPEPRTIVKGVSCLPPGHWAAFENGGLTVRKYWDLAFPPSNHGEEPLELRACLADTVRRHLIADVPL